MEIKGTIWHRFSKNSSETVCAWPQILAMGLISLEVARRMDMDISASINFHRGRLVAVGDWLHSGRVLIESGRPWLLLFVRVWHVQIVDLCLFHYFSASDELTKAFLVSKSIA